MRAQECTQVPEGGGVQEGLRSGRAGLLRLPLRLHRRRPRPQAPASQWVAKGRESLGACAEGGENDGRISGEDRIPIGKVQPGRWKKNERQVRDSSAGGQTDSEVEAVLGRQ